MLQKPDVNFCFNFWNMPPPPPYSLHSVQGQCALISGASSGIGEACAWRLAEAGCRLVVLARRADKLAVLKQEIEATHGVAVHIAQLDVRDVPAVLNLPQTLPDEFKDVDILVNNAGLALGVDPCDELSMEDASNMISCNITGVVAMTRAFAPGMRQRNRGHIVNMSSIAGT